MIINQSGAEFIYDGASYKIGDRIIGTPESEYEGLFGFIFEFRDGEDKETDNETPDIHIAEAAEARIQIGRRVLWNVDKIKEYINQISY